MNPSRHIPAATFALLGLLALAFPATSQATIVLFEDNFNRPNNTNLNASATGKSGSLGALDWVQVAGGNTGGSFRIESNRLRGGDNAAGGGFAVSYLNHNFVDSAILDVGSFSVSLDLVSYATGGAVRYMGVGVGQSQAELAGWSSNNPTTSPGFPSDLFVGYRGNLNGGTLQVFNGATELSSHVVGALGPNGRNLRIDYELPDFNAGSQVDYRVFLDNSEITTGSFLWSGTNENYISLYSNLTSNQAFFDNFSVSTVPEPGTGLLVGLGALGLLLRRRRA